MALPVAFKRSRSRVVELFYNGQAATCSHGVYFLNPVTSGIEIRAVH